MASFSFFLKIVISCSIAIFLLFSDGFFSACLHAATDEAPQLNWFELEQGASIGRGSFGEVYRGRWRTGGIDVAIKVLSIPTISEREKRDFDQEVNILWKNQFPRVVRLYGVCLDPGHLSMVLELMHGSLHDLLHSDAVISDKHRWQIAIDVVQGLSDLHRNHVLHRDLKSHNILIDARGRAKIADFGLARLRLATNTRTNNRASPGTLRWCAPECLNIRPPAPHTSMDMYSYGIILWELLTHRIPFEDQPDDIIVKDAVKSGEREEIPENCPDVWQEVITGCWQQDSQKRPDANNVRELLIAAQPEKTESHLWFFEDKTNTALPHCGYAFIEAREKDWEIVLRCYQHHPVPGYDVGRVEVIYHPAMNHIFSTSINMLQQRKGNRRYVANWTGRQDAEWRRHIDQKLSTLAEDYVDENYPDVKLIPLWHGTQNTDDIHSILSTGYAPFGDTDDAYFGKGIYMAHEAHYASRYAFPDGRLILNWVASYSSYPIISDDFDPIAKKLRLRIPAGKYDSHFVPVVSQNPQDPDCMDYIPTCIGEEQQNIEMIVFEKAHILPRYVVTLQGATEDQESQQLAMRKALQEREERSKQREERINRLSPPRSVPVGGGGVIPPSAPERAVVEAKRIADLSAAEAKQASNMAAETKTITRVPDIARGHEEVYRRFINGRLVYKGPAGERSFLIADIVNSSLEGEFNLNGLTYTFGGTTYNISDYLRIKLGYRKVKENDTKVTTWLVPQFVACAAGSSFSTVSWESDVGIFWTYGKYDLTRFDYLTSMQFDKISSKNLYECGGRSVRPAAVRAAAWWGGSIRAFSFIFK
jgi:serine/threonine protein kinase